MAAAVHADHPVLVQKESTAETFEGSVLVVDVSGFTALTAELEAQHGRRGADRLATLMDALLGSLAEIAERHCGTIVDIVGDSLQIIWATGPSEDLETTATQAADAALAMLDHAATAGADAGTRLLIRAGLAAGGLVRAEVGGHQGEFDRLLWGPAFIEAALMTAVAEPATVAVAEASWPLLQSEFSGRPRKGWQELGKARHRDVQACAIGHVALDMGMGWGAELRSASILFVRLFKAEELGRLTLVDVNASVRMVQDVAARHGGMLDKVHVDEKGMSAVLGFGIPPAQVTAAAVRALAAAVDLRSELREHGTDAAIGVATGKLRAGVGGTNATVHHTIYGGAANLAARCMQAARDEILTDAATRKEAGDSFEYFLPEKRALKGLAADTLLFGVGNPKHRQAESLLSDSGPIAGRAAEVDKIESWLADPDGRLLLLEGEVGVGKSRLVAHAAALATATGHALLVGRAGALGSRTPLFAWRDAAAVVLAGWGRSQGLKLDAALVALAAEAGVEPDLVSLANPLFGRSLADAPGLARIEQAMRPRLARRLQARLMQHLLGPGALLLVVEDAHWLDDASTHLLVDLLQDLPHAKAVVAGRSPIGGAEALLKSALGHSMQVLPVAPLDAAGISELLTHAVEGFQPGHPLADWVYARSRGNPLFTRELLAAIPPDLLAAGLISPGAWRDAEATLRNVDLPATIEEAAIARLGAQPYERLSLLKAASILGSAFDVAAIAALDVPVAADSLEQELDALVEQGLLLRQPGEPPRWRFAQALVMSTVYESLPERTRAGLHRRAVQHLERQPPAAARAASAEIAHHWHQAGVPEKALQPLRRAGLSATAAGAYGDALQFFERAIAIAERQPHLLSPLRHAQLHLELANAQMSIGENAKALAPALKSLDGLWPGAPKTPFGWGMMAAREAALLAATVSVPQFHAGDLRSTRKRMANQLRCEAATRASDLYFLMEGTIQPVALSLFAARAAERTGNLALAARPYGLVGYVAGLLGLHRVARFCTDRAHADCLARNDHSGLHRVHGSRAMLATSLGRWDEGRADIAESLRLNTIDRSERNIGMALSVATMFELWQGNFPAARQHALDLQALGQSMLDDQFLLWSELHLGRIDERERQVEQAAAHYERGLQVLSRGREAQAQFSLTVLLARCRLHLGQEQQAFEQAEGLVRAQEAAPLQFASIDAYAATADVLNALLASGHPGMLPLAERANRRLAKCAGLFPIAQPFAHLHAGQLQALKGKQAAARKIWTKGLKRSETLKMPFEEALLHAAVAAAGGPAHHAEKATRITARIGAGALPNLPIRMKGQSA